MQRSQHLCWKKQSILRTAAPMRPLTFEMKIQTLQLKRRPMALLKSLQSRILKTNPMLLLKRLRH